MPASRRARSSRSSSRTSGSTCRSTWASRWARKWTSRRVSRRTWGASMTLRSASAAAPLPLALVLVLAAAPVARAFPGSVRWGYANCSTCHYNVAGGGVLTPYGRQLSRELLSTWGGEREAEFAYGSTPLPAWLALGGDLEYLAADSAFRLVQADLEAAATAGPVLAVATIGRHTDAVDPMGDGVMSRRHYLQLSAGPSLSVRGGRFSPNYGVWSGDASIATWKGLGLDQDSYNVEANWVSERWSASLTGILASTDGRPAERGIASTVGVFFGGKRKVWLSFLSRRGPDTDRTAG